MMNRLPGEKDGGQTMVGGIVFLVFFCVFQGEWVSMAVCSDGSYGVQEGLMYSFPVTIKDGKWSIVQGLEISDFSRAKMDDTMKELDGERNEAIQVCK